MEIYSAKQLSQMGICFAALAGYRKIITFAAVRRSEVTLRPILLGTYCYCRKNCVI